MPWYVKWLFGIVAIVCISSTFSMSGMGAWGAFDKWKLEPDEIGFIWKMWSYTPKWSLTLVVLVVFDLCGLACLLAIKPAYLRGDWWLVAVFGVLCVVLTTFSAVATHAWMQTQINEKAKPLENAQDMVGTATRFLDRVQDQILKAKDKQERANATKSLNTAQHGVEEAKAKVPVKDEHPVNDYTWIIIGFVYAVGHFSSMVAFGRDTRTPHQQMEDFWARHGGVRSGRHDRPKGFPVRTDSQKTGQDRQSGHGEMSTFGSKRGSSRDDDDSNNVGGDKIITFPQKRGGQDKKDKAQLKADIFSLSKAGGGRWTHDAIAARYDISSKTVQRYIKEVRELRERREFEEAASALV